MKDISFGGVEAIKWKIWSVSGIAASGEEVVPSGMNLSKNIPAEVIAMSGNTAITGLTAIAQLGIHRTPAGSDAKAMAHGSTLLGPGDAIAVEYDTGTTGLCALEIHFHFEHLEDS